jgi:hypothetical protein
MGRFDPNPAGIQAFARGDGMRDGLHQLAEPIQDEAVRITAAEAVDTGLMAASWKVESILTPRGWMVRIWNSATNREPGGENFPYPIVIEFGRTTSTGKHVEGLRILGRALGINQT